MRLLTDYVQWYDGIFNDRPPTFHRQAFTEGGLPKREQFRLFTSLGLRTPAHGVVRDLYASIAETRPGFRFPSEALAEIRLVVYVNELAHRGEGKLLLPLRTAREQHPDCYATVFHDVTVPRQILRWVRFGDWLFWLRQAGQEGEWRSNRGDREWVLTKERADEPNPIPRVLWAIDFLPTWEGPLAIDFNTAPELSTLGETGQLTADEVKAELERAAAETPEQLRQF